MNSVLTALYVGRFFLVVPVVSPMLVGGLVFASAAASLALVFRAASAAAALAPVFLLHLFASASGFAVSARRGHYDLALTTAQPRWAVALLHCAVSAVPGLAAWALLAATEAAMADGHYPVASLASGTVAAFFELSGIAWAINVRVPRLTGAVGWLMVMMAGAVLLPGHAVSLVAAFAEGRLTAPDALTALVCPFSLVGVTLGGWDAVILLPVTALPAAAIALACAWIHWAPVPLEAAQ